jgi:hypothetical protein
VVENSAVVYRFDLLTGRWSVVQCRDGNGNKLALALDSHAAVVYSSYPSIPENHLYLLNGFDSLTSNYFADVCKICLDGISEDKLTYEIIKTEVSRPSPRGNASCCLVGGLVYLFGGGNVDDSYGDLWSYDLDSNKWTELPKS